MTIARSRSASSSAARAGEQLRARDGFRRAGLKLRGSLRQLPGESRLTLRGGRAGLSGERFPEEACQVLRAFRVLAGDLDLLRRRRLLDLAVDGLLRFAGARGPRDHRRLARAGSDELRVPARGRPEVSPAGLFDEARQ